MDDLETRIDAIEDVLGAMSSEHSITTTKINAMSEEMKKKATSKKSQTSSTSDKHETVTIDKKKYVFYMPRFRVTLDGVATTIVADEAIKDKELCEKLLETYPHVLVKATA